MALLHEIHAGSYAGGGAPPVGGAGHALFGLYANRSNATEPVSFTAREDLAGLTFTLHHSFYAFPSLTLTEPEAGQSRLASWVLPTTSVTITGGSSDATIDAAAAQVKALTETVYLRVAWGFNNPALPWGAWTAAEFIAVWSYLRARFQAAGVGNCRWVWTPYSANADPTPYWPGDTAVDVVGSIGFSTEALSSPSPANLFDREATFALAKGKPMWITEVGADDSTVTPSRKPAWVASLNAYLQATTVITALIPHDEDGNAPDCSWATSQSSLSAWLTLVADPWYATIARGPVPTPLGRPTSTAGALALGVASYPLVSGAIYVDSVSGNDANSGAVGAPVKTIARAIALVATGGMIVLRGGASRATAKEYREGVIGVPSATYGGQALTEANVTVQNYPGEAVWLNGSTVVTGWTASGSTWTVPFARTFNRGPTETSDGADSTTVGWQYVNPSSPCAPWPERVWVDDVELQQVSTLGAVGPGKFFVQGSAGSGFNWVSTHYIIGTNPTGHTVSIGQFSSGLSALATGITFRGFGMRRYCPSVAHQGAMKTNAANVTFENLIFEDHSTCPVGALSGDNIVFNRLTVARNGWMGVHGTKINNFLLSNSDIGFSNLQQFNSAPAAGGVKITRLRKATIKGNWIHDSLVSSGLWLDESVFNPIILSNDITDNGHHGVITELCAVVIYADNLIYGSGVISLYTMNNNSITEWNNTVEGGTSQVNLNGDNRAPMNSGSVGLDSRYTLASQQALPMTWVTGDPTIKNNVIRATTTGQQMLVLRDSTSRTLASYGVIDVDGNLYLSDVTPTGPFSWRGTGYSTLAAYKAAAGQEAHGMSIFGSVSLNPDRSLKTAVATTAAAVPRPLPADIAALIGQTAGVAHLGCFF